MADVSITAANVQVSSNNPVIRQGNVAAATTVTAGQTLYITSSNTLGLADSDGVSPVSTVAGIALGGGAAGQKISYVVEDPSFTFGGTATVASGCLYLSDTPGGITQTLGDLESGDVIVSLGPLLTTTTMNLKIVQGGTI